jgi:hypothetical protein
MSRFPYWTYGRGSDMTGTKSKALKTGMGSKRDISWSARLVVVVLKLVVVLLEATIPTLTLTLRRYTYIYVLILF